MGQQATFEMAPKPDKPIGKLGDLVEAQDWQHRMELEETEEPTQEEKDDDTDNAGQ